MRLDLRVNGGCAQLAAESTVASNETLCLHHLHKYWLMSTKCSFSSDSLLSPYEQECGEA